MGLTNSMTSNSKIVTIVNGKFTIRLPEGSTDEKAVKRTLKSGREVEELQYNGLDGKIVNIYMLENDYGTKYVTSLEDENGDRFNLQIPLDSQFFGQYAKRMPNIDKDTNIFFGLGFDKERQRPFLFIKQAGETVPMKFTKAEPNGMPEPTTKEVKGKEVWDWEEQENFLYEIAMDFMGEKEDIPF